MASIILRRASFGGIQFNTALKRLDGNVNKIESFGGIQFNTALKP